MTTLEKLTLDDLISQFRVVAQGFGKPVAEDVLATLSKVEFNNDKFGKRTTAFGTGCKIVLFSKEETGEDYMSLAESYMRRTREQDRVPTKYTHNGSVFVFVDKTRSTP